MKKMTGDELRQIFLDFFQGKDHLILPSASLIPKDDPTLLWINAGMTPLKPYFEGRQRPPHPRVATAQKCIRTNDIENVGRTARHHTFFEMMGNFSFADYFKKEAIAWGWEFVTEILNIPKESLWVSVYEGDEEAAEIWRNDIGVPTERVVYLGKEDNFWEIGDGPCGPCSEIHYDRGTDHSCGPECTLGCDCDRFNEIWNLVFTQYNKKSDGSYETLPQKHIDTGLGLERVLSLLQGAESNYETDLFLPYIQHLETISGVPYENSQGQEKMAFRVIADHIRSVAMTLADGAFPSNEGRGYIIRRILRRASRFGQVLGLKEPFLAAMIPLVVEIMGKAYPELQKRQDYIAQIVSLEEERFHETISQGLDILRAAIREMKEKGEEVFPGFKAFQLYDTYGFPLDLTRDALEEEALTVDEEGFERAMAEQRQRARGARSAQDLGWGDGQEELSRLEESLGESKFSGYDHLKDQGRIEAILTSQGPTESLKAGEKGILVLDTTPFYPEGGGQVGDRGAIRGTDTTLSVENTYSHGQLIFHEGEVLEGTVEKGNRVELEVNQGLRLATARNHTATHLLHKALSRILGQHVQQAGSLVDSQRLRFDFTHFQALTREEVKALEKEVNEQILKNMPVTPRYTSLEEAKEMGAIALFDEKYGDMVRVVVIGEYCQELCGGTHVQATGEIGPFTIISEGAVAAGIRRIEAYTGFQALSHFEKQIESLEEAAQILHTSPREVQKRLQILLEEKENLERRLQKAQTHSLVDLARDLGNQVETIHGYPVIRKQVDVEGPQELRQLGDMIRDRMDSVLIVLAGEKKGKAYFLTMATEDLVQEEKIHAGKLVGALARHVGGGGGGRPDMAQAGGPQAENIPKALEALKEILAP